MAPLIRRCVAEALWTFALVTGPLTGGSFNPARSFGPALASGVWTTHWLYWLAPIAGMCLGMRLYELLRPARADDGRVSRSLGTEGPI